MNKIQVPSLNPYPKKGDPMEMETFLAVWAYMGIGENTVLALWLLTLIWTFHLVTKRSNTHSTRHLN